MLVFDHEARDPYRAVTWSLCHRRELVFGRFARSPGLLTRASLQVVHSTSAERSLVVRILDVIKARTDGTTQDFLCLLATAQCRCLGRPKRVGVLQRAACLATPRIGAAPRREPRLGTTVDDARDAAVGRRATQAILMRWV